ncbi:MAG: glutamate formimidoyltransferase [Acidobacteria bacterium]|nr:glutamate formimidoyltransferase [Acidobacteriota bacterium]
MRLVECVPNFSEGRDRGVIDRITAEAAGVEGVALLDVDPGAGTNRTVVTFAGPPEAVAEAAFRCIRKAAELIDMAKHHGEHPRMGATDVCPFVPLSGVTMEECVEIARAVGKRVGAELGIPVYLYENAASRPERRSLADIRQGEYEGLKDKLKNPKWKPDFGPAAFHAGTGATVIGAREFLIAYNVSLNTKDRRLAEEIALNIREAGRPKKGPDGKPMVDASGEAIRIPGTLTECRATGWVIPEYGRAQVSINLTNYRVTPPHAAFEEVCRQAAALGLRVTGSEIVGLIPLEAMLMAGRYYRERQGKSPAVPERDLIEMAGQSLALSDVGHFDPSKKIIEHRFRGAAGFASRTVLEFVDDVAADTPAPGGGSVAALCGSLAAGLAAMVAGITYPRKDAEANRPKLAALGGRASELKAQLLASVQADSDAFDRMMAARRLKAATPGEKAVKEAAVLEATIGAVEVPLSVVRGAAEVLSVASEVAAIGAASALSDAGVAALAALAAAEGAFDNVVINLPGVTDPARAGALRREADAALASAKGSAAGIRARVERELRAAAK